jgi:Tol biopolymer transport system component
LVQLDSSKTRVRGQLVSSSLQRESPIAFLTDRDGNYEIYVMNADGTSQTPLKVASNAERKPAWSPDGTKIAYAYDKSARRRTRPTSTTVVRRG